MKKILKYLIAFAVTSILLGCGGMANIKSSEKNSSYDKQVTSLLVVIEASHLTKAFVGDATALTPTMRNVQVPVSELNPGFFQPNPKERLQHLDNAINGIKNAFASVLRAHDVDVTTEVVNIAVDQSAVLKAVANSKRKQFLILSTDTFQTLQQRSPGQNSVVVTSWTGKVSWTLALYDLDKSVNPEGKVVWKAKTDLFSLGISDCGIDAYKACTTRFANAVVDQMRGVGLLGLK